jgi:ubiquinone/menaquinone biosynthesis C-methylase UbiE
MASIGTANYLKENYAGYYQDGQSEWRRLGALGKADNIVSLCNRLPQNSVIEIGAGEGAILQRLSELRFGEELYALEISLSGSNTIKQRQIPRLRECQVYDGYTVPYSDNRFDLAILSHVIEHVEHPRKLLYEAARVARYVFVEVPLEDTVRSARDFVFDSVGHINFYSPKTIRKLVQSCGLQVLDERISHFPKSVYSYQKGSRGISNFHLKDLLLRISPNLAAALLVYNAALVCERTAP